MEPNLLAGLEPTLDMIAEELEDALWECQRSTPLPDQTYRGVLPYTGQSRLDPGILYLVKPEQGSAFPEGYSCVSSRRVSGWGNRLCFPGKSEDAILQQLLELFCRLRDQEAQLNRLVFSGGSLEELCRLGQSLTGKAVCIHDDWFLLIAMSEDAMEIMPPERLSGSNKGLVPRQVLEEFKFDTDYDRTYSQQRCQLWTNAPNSGRCLYVNLWEEQRYRGRLLLFESDRAFRRLDYLMAESLAQRARLLMRQQKRQRGLQYRNLDDMISALLEGREPEPGDLRFLLDTLKWQEEDPYLCVRLQSQQEEISEVLGHVLHSDLFRFFPGSYIMYLGRQQCLILNLAKSGLSLSEIRYRLSPLCRDYCLYAGVSAPVNGIQALKQAARQSDIALERAFYRRNEQWILPFSDCALEHMLDSIETVLEPRYLAAAEWFTLLGYDREKDTRYFETLKTYLLLERDIPKTAEKLIIHRTTLLYRLKKIISLTGLDLDDPDRRLYLLLSLRLLEQQRLIPADR